MKQIGVLLIVIALVAFVFSGVFSPDRSIFPLVNWWRAIFDSNNEQVSEYKNNFNETYNSQINEIEIDVVSSHIEIMVDDSLSDIKVTYQGNGEFDVSESKDSLKIEEDFNKWNLGSVRKGNLVIKLPQGVDEIILSTVSGNIELEDLRGDLLEINNVSGRTILDNVEFEKIEVENISGRIQANNIIFSNGFLKNVSAGISVKVNSVWDEFSIETVSGDVDLTLDPKISPNITYSSVSGKLTSRVSSGEKNNCDLEIDTVSGDATVKTN
ncbi:MAG: DUF4097 family beta strand repeat-containing protein [Clostridia bacterium]